MLQQESELTVEELLARYKGMREEESAEEETSGERSSQAEGESDYCKPLVVRRKSTFSVYSGGC